MSNDKQTADLELAKKEIKTEKLRQLISRNDMSGNEKLEWLTNFMNEQTSEIQNSIKFKDDYIEKLTNENNRTQKEIDTKNKQSIELLFENRNVYKKVDRLERELFDTKEILRLSEKNYVGKNAELQKDIEKLIYNNDKLAALVKINTELREHLNLVPGESIIGTIKRIQLKYTTLKQSADEMDKAINTSNHTLSQLNVNGLVDNTIYVNNQALDKYKKQL